MECIEFRTQKDKIFTLLSGHVRKLEIQPHIYPAAGCGLGKGIKI